MQTDDKARFLEAISALAALFSRELDDAAIALYWEAVRHLSLADFQSAVRAAAKTATRFPVPAELIAASECSTKLRAAEAWPEVMKLATHSSADHSDPIAAEAIRLMGGGKRLGQMPTDDLEVWGRKRFEELYEEIASKPEPVPMLADGPAERERVRQAVGGNFGDLVKGIE